jgi:hypothetical protein
LSSISAIRAPFRQRPQGGRQARLHGLTELLEVLRRLLEHAGPTQHFVGCQGPRIAEHVAHLLFELAQPFECTGNDRIRCRAAFVGADLQRAVDFPALDGGPDELSALGFYGAQLFG